MSKNWMRRAVEKVKRGRRLYGCIFKLSDGSEVYIARRKEFEIYRARQHTLSEALAAGVAGWALDVETLLKMRLRGVRAVGVYVEDHGDLYLTSITNYFDSTIYRAIDYSRVGGSEQRSVTLNRFRKRAGRVRIR